MDLQEFADSLDHMVAAETFMALKDAVENIATDIVPGQRFL